MDDKIEDIKYAPLDIEIVRTNVPSYSSEKLCEMIVCDRYFNFNREIAIICMKELASRREKGDDFQFEDYIEKSYNTLPKLDFGGLPDLSSMLQHLIGKNLKKP
jgi:hypothetical protein